MTISQHTGIAFYRNLGKLFYAIAAADKVVKKAEVDKLKELVKQKWMRLGDYDEVPYEKAAKTIMPTFNWLSNDGEYDANTCFKEFVLFKKKHESLFNERIKQLILETADAIAYSFARKNKSELIMLAKLSIELKK